MKKKIFSLLLAVSIVLGVALPGAQAAAEEELYFMEAVSSVEKKEEGGQIIKTEIYGGLKGAGDSKLDAMGSFTLTLDYPKDQLKLVSFAPTEVLKLIGTCEQNQEEGDVKQGSMCFIVNDPKGILVRPGEGMLLAEAEFEILPEAKTGDVTIGIKDGEIVRYRDQFTSCYVKKSTPVPIVCAPMLSLPESGLVQDTVLEPEFYLNPAGTLVSALYSAGGQLLRYQSQAVPANAESQQVNMNLTGGSYVKMFLLGGEDLHPLCPAARMELK